MDWWQIATAQDGAISHAQLNAGGLSTTTVARMARSGELVRVSRGVYRLGGAPHTLRARQWSAVLATNGALSHTTAGRLWGIYDDEDPMLHVTIARERRLTPLAGVVIHRRDLVDGAFRVRCGLAVTSRSQTVLDLLATLPPREASRLADRCLQRHWLGVDELARHLTNAPRRRGNPQLRRLAAQVGDGAAAKSERVLHRLLRRAGITGWQPNYEVWSAGELVGIIDVAIPSRALAIEVDGMAYHVDVDRFRHDRARQNELVALGWTVLRFTWADLTERPGYVIAAITRLAA